MKKLFATILILCATNIFGYEGEVNLSYDYFRSLPDGSWNGNTGAFLAVNMSTCFREFVEIQLGGSYGFYNWEGRENLVFKNSKKVLQQGYITVGASTSLENINLGILYDRQFDHHFGIYDLNVSLDQLRFQVGYQLCQDELGIWGANHLSTEHKHAMGVPISFRTINQINGFWTHYFEGCAYSTVWIGAPYGNSLRHHHKAAGVVTAGFALRALLSDCLYVDAHGAYMRARKEHSFFESRNYAANICVGITYLFGPCCYKATYMPLANNSNFIVDTNINQ